MAKHELTSKEDYYVVNYNFPGKTFTFNYKVTYRRWEIVKIKCWRSIVDEHDEEVSSFLTLLVLDFNTELKVKEAFLLAAEMVLEFERSDTSHIESNGHVKFKNGAAPYNVWDRLAVRPGYIHYNFWSRTKNFLRGRFTK